MQKQILIASFLLASLFGNSQSKITWLGVDFSHVKLIGEFSEFGGAGTKSTSQVQEEYFPAWNMLFINEPTKYDVRTALRALDVTNDIDPVMKKNASTATADITAYNPPKPFTKDDVQKIVNGYSFDGKEGIGVLLIAECLNKGAKEGFFDFVIVNMKTKEIIILDRYRGEPGGFGIRNYWAGALSHVIKEVAKKHYKF